MDSQFSWWGLTIVNGFLVCIGAIPSCLRSGAMSLRCGCLTSNGFGAGTGRWPMRLYLVWDKPYNDTLLEMTVNVRKNG